jgi:hypothetical protein
VPRIDFSVESRQRRSAPSSERRRGGVKICGVYALLREQERVYGGEPDPRWAYTEACERGDPYPANRPGSADLLPALESGAPVDVTARRVSALLAKAGELGLWLTAQRPAKAAERFFWTVWQDRSIVGLRVYSDDMVVPLRERNACDYAPTNPKGG